MAAGAALSLGTLGQGEAISFSKQKTKTKQKNKNNPQIYIGFWGKLA